MTQTGCKLAVSCGNGTLLSGTMAGASASLSGTSQGLSITCTASFTGATSFSLACNLCNATGTKQ